MCTSMFKPSENFKIKLTPIFDKLHFALIYEVHKHCHIRFKQLGNTPTKPH